MSSKVKSQKSKVKSIGVGSDHRGFKLKENIKKFLKDRGYKVTNFGVFSEERADYPKVAFELAHHIKAVPKPKTPKLDFGILVCGSGIGMSISANKVKGIRAALCLNPEFAKRSRQHNDANILVLAADFTTFTKAKNISEVFLSEKFLGERHATRIQQISDYENKKN